MLGCSSQPISLLNATLDEGIDAPIPPTQEELRSSKSLVAFLPIQYSENLSRYHKTLSDSFVKSMLEEHGDLQILEDIRVDSALNRSEFSTLKKKLKQNKLRQFEGDVIDQAVLLGKWLKVRYIVLMKVQSSPIRVSENDWSTYVIFRIYRVEDPVKNEMNHEFNFVFSESNNLWEELGEQIRGRFPLSGFILESRENRTFLRISLGRKNRVVLEQECKIFRRIEKEQAGSNGIMTKVTDFDLKGKMKIFNVQEDFSWGKVPAAYRDDILKGDAVRCY